MNGAGERRAHAAKVPAVTLGFWLIKILATTPGETGGDTLTMTWLGETLFWAAFILTRPLGATVGDWLDKPVAQGGLAFSRPLVSLVLAVAIAALIAVLPQRPASGAARR